MKRMTAKAQREVLIGYDSLDQTFKQLNQLAESGGDIQPILSKFEKSLNGLAVTLRPFFEDEIKKYAPEHAVQKTDNNSSDGKQDVRKKVSNTKRRGPESVVASRSKVPDGQDCPWCGEGCRRTSKKVVQTKRHK